MSPYLALAGTTGLGRRLEALAVASYGTGDICIDSHIQDYGWLGDQCVASDTGTSVYSGTTGQGLRMEAAAFSFASQGICAEGHVQNQGWQGMSCRGPGQTVYVGTTGQGLRLEATRIGIA